MDERTPVGDWTPDEFRREAHRVVDWVADYLAGIEERPVLARVRPGDITARLPLEPPAAGEPFPQLLADLEREVMPGVTHWNHPGFMAFFGITGSAPGILGELVSVALNTNGMLWRTNPAGTELEERVLSWLLVMLGLPRDWFGQIVDLGSTSTLLALAAAREACPELDVREDGLSLHGAPRLRVYTSGEAHSSVEKAAIVLGLGRAGLRKIPVDDAFAMRVDALEAAIEEDLQDGWRPIAVVGTVGTTSTTAVDPIARIADVCRQRRLWLHVDAAYGGAAGVLPEMRWILEGCEAADSFYVNPHKWLFVPVDCSAFYTRHPDTLRRAFQLVPAYLETHEARVTNFMDYGFQLGRRFRAIKLWWVIRSFGVLGIQARLRRHIELAREFAMRVDAHPRFERLAPQQFSVVVFRALWPGLSEEEHDAANEELLDQVNRSGVVFLSQTRVRGRLALRIAIGNLRTEERHVAEAWRLLEAGLAS